MKRIAVDVEWVTERIVYVVEDGSRGAIGVLKYTGPLPKRAGLPPLTTPARPTGSEQNATAEAEARIF